MTQWRSSTKGQSTWTRRLRLPVPPTGCRPPVQSALLRGAATACAEEYAAPRKSTMGGRHLRKQSTARVQTHIRVGRWQRPVISSTAHARRRTDDDIDDADRVGKNCLGRWCLVALRQRRQIVAERRLCDSTQRRLVRQHGCSNVRKTHEP
eukprot:7379930-Prymnesium_polylepis.3